MEWKRGLQQAASSYRRVGGWGLSSRALQMSSLPSLSSTFISSTSATAPPRSSARSATFHAVPEMNKNKVATSSDPWSLRVDLAAAYRLAALNGWEEGICNHFTCAVDDDHFLVLPFGLHFSEIRASDLLLVDARDGKVVDRGSGRGIEPTATAFFLHSRIHLKLKHARVLLHSHLPYTTALTMIEGGRLEMCHQNSMRFQNTICYDEQYNGLVLDNSEGDRLAELMKDNKHVLFMGNHGVMVAHRTVSLAWNTLYYVERACMHQVLAMSTGRPLRIIDKKVCQEAAKYYPGSEEELYADNHFAALKRKLDKEAPDYKY